MYLTGSGVSASTANLFVSTSNNVGIGTTSPSYLLHVADGTTTTTKTLGAFLQPSLASGYYSTVQVGGAIAAYQSAVLLFQNNGTNTSNVAQLSLNGAGSSTINITSTGVGIGTGSPAFPLDVSGGVVIGATSGERVNINANNIGFNRNTSTGAIYSTSGFAYQWQHTPSTTAASDNLALQVYNTSGVSTSGAALTVNGNGYVGIGTGSPVYTLDMLTSQASGIRVSSTTSAINQNPTFQLLRDIASTDVSSQQHGLQFETGRYSDYKRLAIGVLSDGIGYIQVKEANVGYNKLCLNPVAGNVGIGGSGPAAKLAVVTSGSANQTGPAWSDSWFTVGTSDGGAANAVGLGWNTASQYGVLSSVQPTVAWREMRYVASKHTFYTYGAAGASVTVGGTATLDVIRPGASLGDVAIMVKNNGSGTGVRIQTYDLTADPNAWMGLGTDMGGNPYEHSLVFPYGSTGQGRQTVGYFNGSTYSTRSYILTSSTNWVAISDIRSKDIVRPISNVLPLLSNLSTVVYTLKDDIVKTEHLGLIAQEVAAVFPEACDIPEDPEQRMGITYTELVPVLVEAVKELTAENSILKARLDTIEQKLGIISG